MDHESALVTTASELMNMPGTDVSALRPIKRPTPPKPNRLPVSREAFQSHCLDRKSTRLNSSHSQISYAVFCLKKKKSIPGDVTLDEDGVNRCSSSDLVRAIVKGWIDH